MDFEIEYLFDENGAISKVAIGYEDFKRIQDLILEARMVLNKDAETQPLEINIHKLTVVSKEE